MKPVEKKLICVGGYRNGHLMRDTETPQAMTPEDVYCRYSLNCGDETFNLYIVKGMGIAEALRMLAVSYVNKHADEINDLYPSRQASKL